MDLLPGVPPFKVFLGTPEAVGHLENLVEKKREAGEKEMLRFVGPFFDGLIKEVVSEEEFSFLSPERC